MHPSKHTPLIALPALVMDLETTGLDVKSDRVIQIGALNMHGAQQDPTLVINQLVRPGIMIPATSTIIHKIKDADVATAPTFFEVAEMLMQTMRGKVIVGQHIAFDLAVLKNEFARNHLVWHQPIYLDISMLVGALQPALFDVSLESVTTFLGVTIEHRHTAHGDCLATANCWEKLIPLLQQRNIRTLGQALAFSKQRNDLQMRQMESGWLEIPAGLVMAQPDTPQRIDSYVFKHRLADVMTRPAPLVDPNISLRAAAQQMVQQGLGCVCIRSPLGKSQGIITEHDIMRITADAKQDMDTTPVSSAMSAPVECIQQDDMLYRALARMDRLDIGYLCVVDDDDMPMGVVSQRNLLQYRARGSNLLFDAIESSTNVNELAAAYGSVVSVAEQLNVEALNGLEIANVISSEIQSLILRASQLALNEMQADGQGAAPSDWCVLLLGSGGRGESLLSTDQDNALIHTGTTADDAWFKQFGERIAQILNSAGLPFCKGGVMISNQPWRDTVDGWNQRVAHWIQRANSKDLLNVDIFFDLIAVAGNNKLAQQLHQDAVMLASKSHAFINLLARSVQSVAPQFGLFGGMSLTDGRIDLKRNGLLPLVSFARTLALRLGCNARDTTQRLMAAITAGRIPESDGVRLMELHKMLLTIILKQQLHDVEAGKPASTMVDIKQLNKREGYRLKHELHHLDTMVDQIHTFTISG